MGRFERLGFLLVAAGAAVVFGAFWFPEFVPIDSTTAMFYGLVPVVLGLVVTQLQTLVTPTPGRIAMTTGLVVAVLVFLDYAPSLALVGALALLTVGGLLRHAEITRELTR